MKWFYLFLTVWFFAGVQTARCADADMATESERVNYGEQRLSVVGDQEFQITRGDFVLTADQFARLTHEKKALRMITARQFPRKFFGTILALSGGGASLVSLFSGFALQRSFGGGLEVVYAGALVAGLSSLVLIAGVILIKHKVKPSRIWSRAGAQAFVREYNEALIGDLYKRQAVAEVELSWVGNGLGLAARF